MFIAHCVSDDCFSFFEASYCLYEFVRIVFEISDIFEKIVSRVVPVVQRGDFVVCDGSWNDIVSVVAVQFYFAVVNGCDFEFISVFCDYASSDLFAVVCVERYHLEGFHRFPSQFWQFVFVWFSDGRGCGSGRR